MPDTGCPRIAVVGAGIAGLAAAWEARRRGADVVVVEAADRVGGKLRTSSVPGVDFPVDEGADAFLVRVPDALELCDELGIETLEHPVHRRSFVYARGALRPLPGAHVLGVPADVDDLAATGLVSDDGLATLRHRATRHVAAPTSDVSIAAICDERLGSEVTTNVVEPLVGGINAGEADELSAAAVAPQIWALAQRGGSLVEAAAAVRRGVDTSAPVFAAPVGGMAAIADALGDRLGPDIRLGTPAGPIEVTVDGRVRVGGVADHFDGVVVTTPAPVSARLLGAAAPDAAAELAAIDHASVVMVTLVFDAASVDHPLDGSGFVVARDAGLSITACSWGSSKWDRWDDGRHVVLRVSLGHHGDPVDRCGLGDDELLDAVRADLVVTMGLDATPTGVRVSRWPGAFAQYRPGHLDRVVAVADDAAAAGPIRLASSALGGVGVPACIRQGRDAVRSLLDG